MKRGIPKYLTHALQRHPVLLADLLAIHNRCRTVRNEPRTLAAGVLAVALSVLMVAAAAVKFHVWLASGLRWMSSHAVWIAAGVGLYGAMQVARRRPLVEQRHALSWLIAAPRVPATLRIALLLRTLWPLGVQLAILSACVLVIGSQHLPANAVWVLMGWAVCGGLLGAIAGWWLGAQRAVALERYEDSRYVPRVRRASAHRPSLDALSRLPVARALAWHRPENAKVLVLVVLATMPAGTSALTGGCAVLAALLLSYAGALVHAVMQTGSEAARWLQATPIRFLAFAWPIMRRAVLHQLVLSVCFAALLLPLGAALTAVSYLVVLWLTLVVMTWTLWLHGCFHGERPLLKAVGSVATTLGVEHIARGWGIACALLWTLWSLRTRAP